MAVLDINLQGILKMKIDAKVDNIIDKVCMVVLRIFRVYLIPNNSIHQCCHLHTHELIFNGKKKTNMFNFSVPGVAMSSLNKQQI